MLHRLLLRSHELVRILGWIVDESLVIATHRRQLVLQERFLAGKFAGSSQVETLCWGSNADHRTFFGQSTSAHIQGRVCVSAKLLRSQRSESI